MGERGSYGCVGVGSCDHKGAPVAELMFVISRQKIGAVYMVLAAARCVEAVVAVGGRRLSIELGKPFDWGDGECTEVAWLVRGCWCECGSGSRLQ